MTPQTAEEREASPAYVGLCATCGACRACIVATADVPKWEREVAKFCAQMIRDGLTLERKTVGETRAMNWDCANGEPCPKRAKKQRAAKQESLL